MGGVVHDRSPGDGAGQGEALGAAGRQLTERAEVEGFDGLDGRLVVVPVRILGVPPLAPVENRGEILAPQLPQKPGP